MGLIDICAICGDEGSGECLEDGEFYCNYCLTLGNSGLGDE